MLRFEPDHAEIDRAPARPDREGIFADQMPKYIARLRAIKLSPRCRGRSAAECSAPPTAWRPPAEIYEPDNTPDPSSRTGHPWCGNSWRCGRARRTRNPAPRDHSAVRTSRNFSRSIRRLQLRTANGCEQQGSTKPATRPHMTPLPRKPGNGRAHAAVKGVADGACALAGKRGAAVTADCMAARGGRAGPHDIRSEPPPTSTEICGPARVTHS